MERARPHAEYLFLYARWGFTSPYHWTIGAVWPLFLAAQAVKVNCHRERCVAASINDHRWPGGFPMLETFGGIFGFHVVRGDALLRMAPYSQVAVGSFNWMIPSAPLLHAQ